MSEARASRLIARLPRNTPRTVLDIGCGWGAEIREQVDQHRSVWLRGYYGLLGQAYLSLVPAG